MLCALSFLRVCRATTDFCLMQAHVSFDPDATSKLKSACEMPHAHGIGWLKTPGYTCTSLARQSFVNDLMVFRVPSPQLIPAHAFVVWVSSCGPKAKV